MRATLVIISLLGLLLGPIWMSAICVILLSVRWSAWEVVMLGILVDTLWLPSTLAHGLPIATLVSIALVWALEPLRRELLNP